MAERQGLPGHLRQGVTIIDETAQDTGTTL